MRTLTLIIQVNARILILNLSVNVNTPLRAGKLTMKCERGHKFEPAIVNDQSRIYYRNYVWLLFMHYNSGCAFRAACYFVRHATPLPDSPLGSVLCHRDCACDPDRTRNRQLYDLFLGDNVKLSALTIIETIEERFETFNHRKINPTLPATVDNLTSDRRSIGWYIRLTGSSAIFVGSEKPPDEFKAGVMVKLSIEPFQG